MLLDLNFKFKGLDGIEIGNNNDIAAKVLAQYLIGKTDNIPAVKAMIWAQKLWNDGKVEIDQVDLEELEKFVINLNKIGNLPNISTVPILDSIKNCKNS